MTPEAQAEIDLFTVHLKEQHLKTGKKTNCRFCFPNVTPCPHCGLRERHFMPSSLGEPGFYICETVTP